MSIPADLSKKAMDVFREKATGKIHICTGGEWSYTEDLQAILDAVCEMTLRWAQEKIE